MNETSVTPSPNNLAKKFTSKLPAEAKETAMEVFSEIEEAMAPLRDAFKQATAFVKRHPIAVLAVAGAIGGLAAWALSRRKPSEKLTSTLKKAA